MDALDEKIVLGEILSGAADLGRAAGRFEVCDFTVPEHRRIWLRMMDLRRRGEPVDRITVANELMKHGELESCGGLSRLIALSAYGDQLP